MNILQRTWNFLSDYTENSSVHGVKYIFQKKRHFCERIFWIFALILCFTVSTLTINEIFMKWQTNPVYVTLSEKATPISSIPFPAVTICPMTKFNKTIFNFTRAYELYKQKNHLNIMSEEELKNFDAAVHVCNCDHSLNLAELNTSLTGGDIATRIKNMYIESDEIFKFCTYRETDYVCSEIINYYLTEEGYCFSYNMLSFSDILKHHQNKE